MSRCFHDKPIGGCVWLAASALTPLDRLPTLACRRCGHQPAKESKNVPPVYGLRVIVVHGCMDAVRLASPLLHRAMS